MDTSAAPQVPNLVQLVQKHQLLAHQLLQSRQQTPAFRRGHHAPLAPNKQGQSELRLGGFQNLTDLEAPVPDGPDDALVGQGEGIEGAGEKGDGPGLLKGEPPVEQALLPVIKRYTRPSMDAR